MRTRDDTSCLVEVVVKRSVYITIILYYHRSIAEDKHVFLNFGLIRHGIT